MKKILIFTIVVAMLSISSCKDDWFTILPKGQANIETLYTKAGVDLLLIGAFADIDGVTAGGNHQEGWSSTVSNWVWGSVQADDAYKGSNFGDQANINDIAGHYVTSVNTYVDSHWKYIFEGVVRANDVLSVIGKVVDMSESDKVLAMAQAKFLRAHFYVELTMVHGKVPWIDETTVNPTIVPNDHLLWPEIQKDMQYAIDNLPLSWTDKGRPTKWAAKTYMARILLLQQKYTEAKPLLQDVYSNGGFTLVNEYNKNYLIASVNNSESIFEIQYSVNSGFSPFLANYGDALNQPSFKSISNFFQPSHCLVSAFRVDANGLPLAPDPLSYTVNDILPWDNTGATVAYKLPVDPRLDWSVARPGVPDYDWGIPNITWIRNPDNGGPYYSKKSTFLKSEKGIYSSTTGRPGANANNFRKFKLSHVILWLAECEAEVGSLDKATLLVNQIRNRAKSSSVVKFANGTPAANYKVEPYPADFATKENARFAIRHEERIEFSGEGTRFFDLVRWGIAEPTLNKFLSVEPAKMPHLANQRFVAGQHEVAPIPQPQIDLSTDANGVSVLKQNPGY
jgi:hypothetical protein